MTGKMLALAKSPYAKHLVVTMLRYGSSEVKEKILKEFHGRVRKLVRHRDAAPVLEFAYTTAANGPQRRSLLAEFYGPQYALFHSGRPLDEVRTRPARTRSLVVGTHATVF
jgi:pumilio family protein 6